MVDPTQVLWRRILAYAIDTVLIGLLAAGAFFLLADLTDAGSSCPDALASGRICFESDGDAFLVNGSGVGSGILVALGLAILDLVVLQGLTGRSVGKMATGVAVVRPDGREPGIWKALVRWVLLVIDTINLLLPLGLWLAMFTRGHRRLGDFAASTYVVRSSAAGEPVWLPGTPVPPPTTPSSQPWGQPGTLPPPPPPAPPPPAPSTPAPSTPAPSTPAPPPPPPA